MSLGREGHLLVQVTQSTIYIQWTEMKGKVGRGKLHKARTHLPV